jgi:DNA-directed RNA polymerase subunit M/transcription elongation factor TFIIS
MKLENLKNMKNLKKAKAYDRELKKIEFRKDIKNKMTKEDIMDVVIEIQDAKIVQTRDVLGKTRCGTVETALIILREYSEDEKNTNEYYRMLIGNPRILIAIKAMIKAKLFPAVQGENVICKITEDRSEELKEGYSYSHILVTYNI